MIKIIIVVATIVAIILYRNGINNKKL